MKQPTIHQFHKLVLQESLGKRPNDQDSFLLFHILHSYAFVLSQPILRDCPNTISVAALTQRHASEVLASFWVGTDDKRAKYTYWYWRWSDEWGSYGHSENLSEDEQIRLEELLTLLSSHPFMERLELED